MTTNTLIKLIRNKILEQTEEIVETSTILTYATLVQQDIVKRFFPNKKILTSTTLPVMNGEAALPVNFGTLYGDAFDNQNRFYVELNIEDFQKETDVRSVTLEGGLLKVSHNDVASITIKFYPTELDITLLQNPSVDDYVHICIVYQAISYCFEDLQNFAMAKFFNDKYEAELAKRISVQSNYEENNQDNGQMFTPQNLIGTFNSNFF